MPWDLDNDRPIYLQLMERIQQDIACTEACMAQNISNEDYRICKRVLAQILRNLTEDAALQTSKKERSKT